MIINPTRGNASGLAAVYSAFCLVRAQKRQQSFRPNLTNNEANFMILRKQMIGFRLSHIARTSRRATTCTQRRSFSDKIADKLLLDKQDGSDPTNKTLAFLGVCLVLYGATKVKYPEY